MGEPIIFRRVNNQEGKFYTLEEFMETFRDNPFSHVKHYSTSGFEGIRAIFDQRKGKLYLITLDEHIKRMLETMDYLFFTKPNNFYSVPKEVEKPDLEKFNFMEINYSYLEEKIIQTVQENVKSGFIDPKNGCYIRPNIYRASHPQNSLGVFPLFHDLVLEIVAFEWGAYLNKDPKVIVYPDYIGSPLRRIKAGANYGDGGVAKAWAVLHGFDEALLLDSNENVLEGSGENVFAFYPPSNLRHKIITPSRDQHILPGTKRNLVIEIIKTYKDCLLWEKPLPLERLFKAAGMAFTGTATGFEPVNFLYDPVEKRKVIFDTNHPIIQRIKSDYEKLISGEPLENKKLASFQKDPKIRRVVEL